VKAILTTLVGVLLVASVSTTKAQQGNEVIVYGHISPVRYEAVPGTGVFLGPAFNNGQWNVAVMNGAQQLQGIVAGMDGFFEFRYPIGPRSLAFVVQGGAAYRNQAKTVNCRRAGIQHVYFKMR
jgi:hypothetical protein